MNSMWMVLASVLLATAGAVQAVQPKKGAKAPAVVEGLVTQVPEGDQLWLTPTDKPALLLQLNDIDAPEPCQVYGEASRRGLAELALNRRASVKIQGRDAQGRTLAVVTIEGVDLSTRMVEEGHAWSTRSKWDFGPLVKEERMARALNRGLHAGGGAMMPREFRQMHGPCAGTAPTAPLAAPAKAVATTARVLAPPAMPATPASRCDGRTRCTQMRSCAEAQYFLANCPGVQMDGDRNGIPCEEQWCNRR